ncbi:MAG TPA: helicase HerA-like domain-containing protein [Candidatus Limnocylindrales bacterium]|jgi:DNA helicase HerA-like ATPase|nr:helicase HerA-like domain-containing protein [Candidatus Limnocylindrales bacterium]
MDKAFHDEMAAGYALTEPGLVIGSPMLGAELANDARVQVALSMMNRHGLIAGATGTGKTKTLQLLAGQLSKAGVPVFVADIKGDLTGMAAPGDGTSPKMVERLTSLGWTYQPSGHPVEYLSLSGKLGAQVRATTHSFGPLLLGKVLGLNDTQTSILSLIFKYCDDNQLPLLDLKDLAATLKYLASDDGKPVLADYGGMSSASVGVLLRSIVVLEQSGADIFFGEPEFDVADLIRSTPEGEGIVSILELSDVMDQPSLFSTFMLWMLARLYETLPEVGDLPKPKLCFFFDEAHLLFDDASKALLDEIERTARLIRSKGVGVYFVTQAPTDVPSSVLAQLGNRVQHALRAFTPDDADALRKTARTFPTTTFYDVEKTITSLGTGEALVTVLSPRGVPTPLAATRLLAPDSSMTPLDPVQFAGRIATSPFAAKYGTPIDRDSAYELINAKIAASRAAAAQAATDAAVAAGAPPTTATGLNQMTPAQQRAEINRQAREMAAAQKAAERERKAQAKAAADARKAQQRTIDTAIRTGGRVVSSKLGQDVIRGVFGTLFGGGKR